MRVHNHTGIYAGFEGEQLQGLGYLAWPIRPIHSETWPDVAQVRDLAAVASAASLVFHWRPAASFVARMHMSVLLLQLSWNHALQFGPKESKKCQRGACKSLPSLRRSWTLVLKLSSSTWAKRVLKYIQQYRADKRLCVSMRQLSWLVAMRGSESLRGFLTTFTRPIDLVLTLMRFFDSNNAPRLLLERTRQQMSHARAGTRLAGIYVSQHIFYVHSEEVRLIREETRLAQIHA